MKLLHTKFGVVHATRPSGALYCKNEIRATHHTEGGWEQVTCTSCLKRQPIADRKIIKVDA